MSIINLLPDDYLHRRAARRTNAICLVLFAIVMAGVLAGVAVSQRSVNNTQKVLDSVNADYEDASKLIEKLKTLDKQKQMMANKAELTTGLLERQPRSYLLAVVTNCMPETACIETLKLYPKKVIIAPAPMAEGEKSKNRKPAKGEKKDRTVVEMEITGLAATDVDVSTLMANLSMSPLSESVDLAYSQDKQIDITDPKTEKVLDKKTFREFQVRMVLKTGVDVLDIIGQTETVAAVTAGREAL